MRTIQFTGQEYETLHDAFMELNFSNDRVISLAGRFFTLTESEFARLEKTGMQPTLWHYHDTTGRVVSVPGRS